LGILLQSMRHRTRSLFSATLVAPLTLLALAPFAQAAEFHVSPKGDDATGDGSAGRPFATIEKARDAARAEKNSKVILAPGAHRRVKTLGLNERDSGTVFTGKGASIVGSVAVPNTAVKVVTDAAILERLLPEVRGKVLEIDLRALGVTDFGDIGPRGFRRPYIAAPLELIVDGKALDLARWPDAGQPGEKIGKVLDKGPVTRNGEKPTRGGIFTFKTDRPARWTQADDIWITGLFENGYADNTVKVKAFDLAKKTLTTVQPHIYGFTSGRVWNRWTALNLLEEISVPGEFMADRKTGKAYFLPPAGFDIATAKLEVTVMKEPLVAFEGATGTVFDGVDFGNSRGMGVYIERGANCRIQNSTMSNLGMVAVSIGKGVSPDPDYRHAFTGTPVSRELGSWHEHLYDNTTFNREAGTGHGVVNCSIHDIGTGAISLGGGDRVTLTPGGNFVENCDIHDFNRWDRTYKAGVNIDGVGNAIRHCKIHDCPAVAIYLHGNEHRIERNEVFNAMTEGDDMGCFYMGRDPSERGTVILNNYWHDIGQGKGSHSTTCIYFDDCGDSAKVLGNIFQSAGRTSVLLLNAGNDFLFDGNIFVDCPVTVQRGGMDRARNTPLFPARLKAVGYQSPVWKAKYPEFQDYLQSLKAMPRRNFVTNNLIIGKERLAKSMTFTGNKFTTDRSMFSSVETGKFSLKPGADIGIPGFTPIPFDTIAGLDGKPVGKSE
jgi:hypothetical protein